MLEAPSGNTMFVQSLPVVDVRRYSPPGPAPAEELRDFTILHEVMSPGEDPGFRVIEDDLSGDAIQRLLLLHADEMVRNSPEGACHFLDLSGLRDPLVSVWSIWDGDHLAGCGALRELDADHGEVKSMRTSPDHLGRGVGRAMLDHIVATARRRSYRRLSLETGTGNTFAAAIHLYESFGFERCGAFGDYEENDFSQFFTLVL